jgi:hypothetical protein
MLKTTSGSSPRIDLSNNITYSQSQSHALVPLNENEHESSSKKDMKELVLKRV